MTGNTIKVKGKSQMDLYNLVIQKTNNYLYDDLNDNSLIVKLENDCNVRIDDKNNCIKWGDQFVDALYEDATDLYEPCISYLNHLLKMHVTTDEVFYETVRLITGHEYGHFYRRHSQIGQVVLSTINLEAERLMNCYTPKKSLSESGRMAFVQQYKACVFQQTKEIDADKQAIAKFKSRIEKYGDKERVILLLAIFLNRFSDQRQFEAKVDIKNDTKQNAEKESFPWFVEMYHIFHPYAHVRFYNDIVEFRLNFGLKSQEQDMLYYIQNNCQSTSRRFKLCFSSIEDFDNRCHYQNLMKFWNEFEGKITLTS